MSATTTTVDLRALADELLTTAGAATSGRATRVLRAVPGGSLSQVVLALLAGQELSEHENPGEALLHVLRGQVRLTAGAQTWDLGADEHVAVPQERHGLLAVADSVVILTVVQAHAQ